MMTPASPLAAPPPPTVSAGSSANPSLTSHGLPAFVRVVEVGPRDGLQNEATPLALETIVSLIDRLSEAGFSHIEAASFVSPTWVPQMAHSAEVMAAIKRRPGLRYGALTPNLRGYERALAAGVDEVVIFGAASEAFSQRNINCSIAESLARFKPVAEAAVRDGLRLRGSISCALGCPYQGEVAAVAVREVAQAFADLGCAEIDIADTIGVGTPERVKAVFEEVAQALPISHLSAHFHDSYGQAIANIYAALQMGVSIVHSAVAGLGGCPYARGATGNVATEDVLFLLHGLGIATGVDFGKVALTGGWISDRLGRDNASRAGKAWLSKHQGQGEKNPAE